MCVNELEKEEIEKAEVLPVLPLRNTVLFPFITIPLSIGRQASVAAIEAALATESKELVVVAQRDASHEILSPGDIFNFGTKAVIRKMARGPEGAIQLIVQGLDRVEIVFFEQTAPYLKARFHVAPLPEDKGA
jgi:ATP-dependent Lon protease